MKNFGILFLTAVLSAGLSSCANNSHHGHSSYAGEENRTVKALSDEDVQKYLDGEGMGLAKAAELNGFPGPKHILENKAQLNLSAEQESKVRDSFQKMKLEASNLGKKIVEQEKQLDKLFSDNQINEEILNGKTREISALQGDLRRVHLQAHLEMKELLSPEQIESYKKARGYTK